MSEVTRNATVSVAISFHEMLKALAFHAEMFPADRIAMYEIDQVVDAACKLHSRYLVQSYAREFRR